MSVEVQLWIKKLFATLIFFGICYGAYLVQSTIFLIVIAGFLTIMITPLAEKWKKYKIPEWLTVVVIYFVIILLASIIVGTLIPIILKFISGLITEASQWATNAQETYMRYGISGFNLPHWLEGFITQISATENINSIFQVLKDNIGSIQSFLTERLGSITSGGISVVSSVGNMLVNIVFIGIATFFMVLERHEIGNMLLNILPTPISTYLDKNFSRMQTVTISWIKATLILGVSIFAMTYSALVVIDLVFPFSIEGKFSLALISGIMEFVPYVGPIISAIPGVLIGLGIGWEAAVIMLLMYVIIQQLENNFLVPFIMSKNLDISPFFVFVIMLVAGTLGGVLGIILAVPVGGVIQLLYQDYVAYKKGLRMPVYETPPQKNPPARKKSTSAKT